MRFLASLVVCLLFAGLASALDKAEYCKCRIGTGRRIVGGKVASPTAYPWHVSISGVEQLPKYEFVGFIRFCGLVMPFECKGAFL